MTKIMLSDNTPIDLEVKIMDEFDTYDILVYEKHIDYIGRSNETLNELIEYLEDRNYIKN